MSRDIYDMINDSIIDLENYEVHKFSDIEATKMKKNIIRKSKNLDSKIKKIAKIAVFSAILGGGIFITPFGEKVLASIELATYDIASMLGISKNMDNYKTVVNQTVTDSGITMKLNEVILDGEVLRVSTTRFIEDSEKSYEMISGMGDFYINGKLVSESGGGSATKISDNTFTTNFDYKIDDISGLDFLENIEMKIKYNKLYTVLGEEFEKIKGNWDFEFTVNAKELLANTKIIKIDKDIKINNDVIKIEKYTSNDLGQKIYLQLNNKSEEAVKNYVPKIVGYDNLGNQIVFDMKNMDKNMAILEIRRIDGEISENATELELKLQILDTETNDDWKVFGDEFKINIE